MPTALLLDDEAIFKAVEGTLLRRENCRLLKAPAERLLDTARAERPDLILTSPGSAGALELCGDAAIGSIPILIVSPAGARVAREFVRGVEAAAISRKGILALVRREPPAGTRAGAGSADARLDAALRSALPSLDRASDRVAADVRVKCEGRGLSLILRTKNLSPTGLFLKTPRPLTRGRRFQVRFRLPEAEPALTAVCEVVRLVPARKKALAGGARGAPRQAPAAGWSEEDLIPGVGVRFVEMDEAAREALSRFVNRTGAAPREASRHGGS